MTQTTMRQAGRVGMMGAVLAVALGALGCGGGTRDGAPSPLPVAPALLDASGMEVEWHTRLLRVEGTRIEKVWRIGDFLVALGSDNTLYAVDAATGVRRWTRRAAEPHQKVFAPAAAEGVVYVATTTHLLGIDARGREVVRHALNFPPSAGVATNGGEVFVPAVTGYLEAIPVAEGFYPWRRWTPDALISRPVCTANLVVFASQSGDIYCSLQHLRRIIWKHKAAAAVVADLARTDGNLVIVPCLDYAVYAFQATSGRLQWQFEAEEPVGRPAVAHGEQVFLWTPKAGMRALDAESGTLLWQRKEARDVAGGTEARIYLVTDGDDLLAVDRADGDVAVALPMRRDVLVPPNTTTDGIVYLAAPTGEVMAIKAKANGGE